MGLASACHCGTSHLPGDAGLAPDALSDSQSDGPRRDGGQLEDGGTSNDVPSLDAATPTRSAAFVGHFSGFTEYRPLIAELRVGEAPVETAFSAPQSARCTRYSSWIFYEGGVVYDGFHSNGSNPDGCPHQIQRRASPHATPGPVASVTLPGSPQGMTARDGQAFLLTSTADRSIVRRVDAQTLEGAPSDVVTLPPEQRGLLITESDSGVYVLSQDPDRTFHLFAIDPAAHSLRDMDPAADGTQGLPLPLAGVGPHWDERDGALVISAARGSAGSEGGGLVRVNLGDTPTITPLLDASDPNADIRSVAYYQDQLLIASSTRLLPYDLATGEVAEAALYEAPSISAIGVDRTTIWIWGLSEGSTTVWAINGDGEELLRWSTRLVVTSLSPFAPME